ncbi:MAG: membrane protein insertion efficiency factor YidD [Rubrivivax sp.]|nr:membrane protein insertion efficiency factor YidD [Rubrivivax sp.]
MTAAWANILTWPRRLLMALVRGYRLLLKPWLGNACRFEPTCSAYALQALERHGAVAGTALTGWRILRCHPWCDGGCDPVPENLPRPVAGLFTRLGLTLDAAPPSEPGPPHPPTRKLP